MKRCLNLLVLMTLSAGVMTSCGTMGVGQKNSDPSSSQAKVYENKTDLRATGDLTKVAFVGDGNEIVVNNGSEEKVVYMGGAFDLDGVQWSPDGRYVSFFRVGYNYCRELMVCDTLTGNVMESGAALYGERWNFAQRYIWSADSKKAIFYSDTGGGYYDVLAERTVEIAPAGSRFYAASFSPDGCRILYCEGNPGDSSYVLKVYELDTGKRSEVYRYEVFNPLTTTPPLWLSDGEILVIETLGSKAYKVEAATGAAQDYPIDCTMSHTLCLSPDRRYLAYQTVEGVIVKNISSGRKTLIKTSDGSTGYPVWGYDNQELFICCADSIWTFGPDGDQIGDTVRLKNHSPGSGRRFSDPVITKSGIWYEGCEE